MQGGGREDNAVVVVASGAPSLPRRCSHQRQWRQGDNPRGTAAVGNGGTKDNDAGQEGEAAKEYDTAGTHRNGGGVCVLLDLRLQGVSC